MSNPTISVVTTMYHSSEYIAEFYLRIIKTLRKLEIDDYEFIFVDDASPDESLFKAVELVEHDPKVTVVQLTKNHGHSKAIMAGLDHCSGDYVFLIDSDLEEPPELLETFWRKMEDSSGTEPDVIFGVQPQRKGGLIERWTGKLYYNIFNWLSDDVTITPSISTVRLMKKDFVTHILLFKEQEFYFGATSILAGWRHQGVTFNKLSHSATTFNTLKKYNLFINSIFSFTKKPLFLIFYMGLFLTVISGLMGVHLLVSKLYFGIGITGWTSVMLSIWFLGGVLTLFLGIISIYISKIFEETRRRPFYGIKKVFDNKSVNNRKEGE